MFLRWSGCYIEDAVTLMVLVCWRCCYVEDLVRLQMLLRWRSCYGDVVDAFAVFTSWRCCYVEYIESVEESGIYILKIGKTQVRRVGQLNGPRDNLEHRSILSAFSINRKPGLRSVLEALKYHRRKVNRAFAPPNALKTPSVLWWIMWFLHYSKKHRRI